MSLKWNKATGIILGLHAEMEEGGENFVIDVDYTSSDVDIYADQSAAEKGWNQAVTFLATPLGIIIIAALVVIIIVLCIKLKVPKKIKRAVKR